ncbi:MAG TPA: alpha/beta hydrolase [Thermomicrobiales bacterium]|jgi:predicted esterase
MSDGIQLLVAGEELARARGAVVMVHGRGASAESILGLAESLQTAGLALLAPQAAGGSWYPYSFLAPLEQNEPSLSAALATIGATLDAVAAAGVPAERTVLLGFSQGACLALEYAARNARRYGGVVGLSGGLIGPDGTPRDYAGSLGDTPVFLGCSDVDFHIPQARVIESAEILRGLGGTVEMRIYPGMGHTVNEDELEAVQGILDRLGAAE